MMRAERAELGLVAVDGGEEEGAGGGEEVVNLHDGVLFGRLGRGVGRGRGVLGKGGRRAGDGKKGRDSLHGGKSTTEAAFVTRVRDGVLPPATRG